MYQREVDVDMLNAVKSLLADVSNINPSSEQRLGTVGYLIKKPECQNNDNNVLHVLIKDLGPIF